MDKALEFPVYLFHQGTNFRTYELMGAHRAVRGGQEGFVFRVWAPHARSVAVTGAFNGWDPESLPMEKLTAQGVWECFVPGARAFQEYKYVIESRTGNKRTKADPYCYHMETRPATASKLFELEDCHTWGDGAWMEERRQKPLYNEPVNIYEVQPGSWRRYPDGNFYSYEKLAEELVPYVKDMGYTHIELMPVTEYPFDGSWGYQVTGYYAPTSRFGTPAGFMAFVDACHQAGLGVILDWVPGHFPKDGDGLARFDGEPCYEYADPQKGEHLEWGTSVFDWGRGEVRSFLISNAMYWLEKYHIDGLRVDAVASMLYLDYNRKEGQWQRNARGGKENLEAVSFLQELNKAVFAAWPNVLMAAEESTAWPMVTHPVDAGGLGFGFKWNMGWMNDSLDYMKTDPLFRRGKHSQMTFALTYAYAENYILPLSHDEVVHGKGSLLGKMPGDYEEKFAQLRAYYAFMTTHPGKKLLFMGGELGQFSEWDYQKELDWSLLGYDMHRKLRDYVRDLNHLYREEPALWSREQDWGGFVWLDANDGNRNVYAFRRMGERGRDLTVLCNFASAPWKEYRAGVPAPGVYTAVLNSDDVVYGGGSAHKIKVRARKTPVHGCPYSIAVDLPPLSALIVSNG
ncbi:MAG: 1,4-alpha-glucan branching protein GlgB [Bacillota bacterium]|nr:1,4-alpha-glucan branching protein GlgB [Bacillota bacterium]